MSLVPWTFGGTRINFIARFAKSNISIYGKWTREILHHHSNKKHLRKDQQWRYEFLSTTDPVTKNKIHQVRVKDNKVLKPYQLELKYPQFKAVELWDREREKLSFYDEVMTETGNLATSSDTRSMIQISVLCRFLSHYVDRSNCRCNCRSNCVPPVANHSLQLGKKETFCKYSQHRRYRFGTEYT